MNKKKKSFSNIYLPVNTIFASNRDYKSDGRVIDLRGGEKRIEKINLVSLSEIEKRNRAENDNIEKHNLEVINYYENTPFKLSFGIVSMGISHASEPNSGLAGISIGIEKKFFRYLGLKLTSFGMTSEPKSDGSGEQVKASGGGYFASLPVYLSSEFYILPMVGKSTRTYSTAQGNELYSLTQTFFGGSVGGCFETERWGGFGELGLVQYSDAKQYAGKSSVVIQLGALWKF